MKKRLAVLLTGVLALCLLAGCGGRQDDPNAETPDDSQQTPAGTESWHEVKDGILTVRLPLEKEGYLWQVSVEDESVLELLTQDDSDGEYVASFRALADGEASVSFSYADGAVLSEIRTLQVLCDGGQVEKVESDGIIPVTGGDDPAVTEMRRTNDISQVMQGHTALTCVSETWDGENNWQYKTVRQFTANDGRLWYDYEQYDENDEVVYCEAGYINIDVPGALYSWEKDGLKTMTLCREQEYEAMVAGRWLARQQGDYELLLNRTEDSAYDNVTLQTVLLNDTVNRGGCETDYFIDSTSGLITGMECREYDDGGALVNVTRSNVFYDEPRLMTERAAMEIGYGEDPCRLTVLIDNGTELTEEQVFLVNRKTLVEFESAEGFGLYCDAAYTEPMDFINVNQDELTVYVVTKSAA